MIDRSKSGPLRNKKKSLSQLAAEADGGEPLQIAGQPADKCPYCGCGMLVNKTTPMKKPIIRYVNCRNPNCGKRFMSRQPPAELVREVGGDDETQLRAIG